MGGMLFGCTLLMGARGERPYGFLGLVLGGRAFIWTSNIYSEIFDLWLMDFSQVKGQNIKVTSC
jgi:hypothetical protein